MSVRVSNNSDITRHMPADECAFWNSNTSPVASSENLTCRETMFGRFLSIQRAIAKYESGLVLCEVVITGRIAGQSVQVITAILGRHCLFL